jgi:ER membrane protein complex subunit 8/9
LVQEQNLHFAFGDFDDHLEDVTIGKALFFKKGPHRNKIADLYLPDWLRNKACLP